MANFANTAEGRAKEAARWALSEIGRRSVAEIRQDLAVRVQRAAGRVIRSEPGESPRRDRSTLWKSIKYRVLAQARSVEALSVYTTDRKAPWLNYGTPNMEARPFWEKARRRMREFPSLFRELYAQRLRETTAAAGDVDAPIDEPPA